MTVLSLVNITYTTKFSAKIVGKVVTDTNIGVESVVIAVYFASDNYTKPYFPSGMFNTADKENEEVNEKVM